ncbi:MAG: SAM-dependent methyltransferase [Pseudolabrys sp.]|nr:SAM-dependent methyltransferase [Pseudolabrys sp.]
MSDNLQPLEKDIRRRIAAAGPMPVSQYMALCLSHPQHGYYITRQPLGAAGDFTTAPEVSQMFGELIGLWAVAVWQQMGAPEYVRLIELGPGRGTLMKDALRAAAMTPAFRTAAVVDLVEISPLLRSQQEETLKESGAPLFWHDALGDVPAGPAIVIANEFFDALPINQAVKTQGQWRMRTVRIADNALAYGVADEPIAHFERTLPEMVRQAGDGEIFEWRDETATLELSRRLMRDGGAALVIDYGHEDSAPGDTFQAVGSHSFADPLAAPGAVDLTAHVDFEALVHAAEAMGVKAFGPLVQADLLRRLGLEQRAAALKAGGTRAQASAIDAAVARLTGRGRTGMGNLFKAVALANPALGTPPGFET